jgi:DNA-binding NarL/FixJ family response regulator
MKRPRIVLADEHTLVIEALRKLLEPEFDVVHLATDGRAAVTTVSASKPDVLLLEIALPLLNGIDVAAQVQKTSPNTKIVFVTAYPDREHVTEALRVGASGYLLKRSASVELFTAIREVVNGRSYLSPLVTNELISTLRDAFATTPEQLTLRQREILQLIAEGYSLKAISRMLNVSQKTVEYHKYGMTQKLGLRTNAELVQYAVAQGIIKPRNSISRMNRKPRDRGPIVH